jgi:hypothetical protein
MISALLSERTLKVRHLNGASPVDCYNGTLESFLDQIKSALLRLEKIENKVQNPYNGLVWVNLSVLKLYDVSYPSINITLQ